MNNLKPIPDSRINELVQKTKEIIEANKHKYEFEINQLKDNKALIDYLHFENINHFCAISIEKETPEWLILFLKICLLKAQHLIVLD